MPSFFPGACEQHAAAISDVRAWLGLAQPEQGLTKSKPKP